MNCIKCGREIPDGELFCVACSLAPEKRETLPRQQHKAAKPAKPAIQRRPVRPAQQPPRQDRSKPKRPRKTAVAIVLLSVLLAVALGFIILTQAQLEMKWRRLRTREADLQLKEDAASEVEKARDDLSLQLAAAREETDRLQREVDQLQRQLNDSEGSVSQAQYDMDAQQQALEDLTAKDQTLEAENAALESQVATLTAEVESLTDKSDRYQEKADFLDSYVVFVNNDGSKLYHSYDCAHFDRQRFWAYSRKLAESSGFTPCPDCQ